MGFVARFTTLAIAVAGSSALTYYLVMKQMKTREKKLRQYERSLQKYSGQNDTVQEGEDGLIAGIVLQLWKQSIQPAASATVQAALEPILKDSLPTSGPFSNLQIVKCDLGSSPIHIKNTVVHEVDSDGKCCQFDMDILWDGDCEIQFDCPPFGKFGIRKLKLFGRMSIQMRPLTDVLPCFGGLSYTFLNPPHLSLEFTGLASVAEFSFLEEKIQSTIQDSINGMMVLPYRMYYKMDESCPLMDMYPPPLSVLRVTIPSSDGFVIEKRNLLKGQTKDDIPDCYVKVQLGNRLLQTETIMDNLKPSWAHAPMDFILSDYDQVLDMHVWDQDKGPVDPDDDLGTCSLTIRELLMARNRTKELPLVIENDDGTTTTTDAKLVIQCDMIPLVDKYQPITSCSPAQKPYLLNGFLSILVIQALEIPLATQEAMTFVHVESSNGKHSFDTGMVKEGPGVNPLNPIYDCNFDIPLGIDETPDITMTLYQKDKVDPELITVLGSLTLKWADMVAKPDLRAVRVLDNNKGSAGLEFGIYLRGVHVKNLAKAGAVAPAPPPASRGDPLLGDRSTAAAVAPPAAAAMEVVAASPSSAAVEETTDSMTPKLKATRTSIPLRASAQDSQSIVDSIRGSERGSELSQQFHATQTKKKVRVVAVSGRGFKIRIKGPFRKKDIPDVYLKIQVAGSSVWQTSVIKDCVTPEWNESKVFKYVPKINDKVVFSAWDRNKGKLDKDDIYGSAETTIDKLLLAGGSASEIELINKKGKATGLFISLQASLVD